MANSRLPPDAGESGRDRQIPDVFAKHPAFLLARARLSLIRKLDAVLESTGAFSRHFALAMLLGERPGLSQVQVSSLLGTDRTTTMNMAAELETLGIIRRARSALDRRHYALHLTPAGRRWIARILPAMENASAEFLAPLSAGEQVLMREWLLRLVQRDLQRDEKATR
ncbi:MAG: MarR family winged helix-turn-helix transcriptional regulator [Panacagrimonas sp.]